jgi:hypothetical protein
MLGTSAREPICLFSRASKAAEKRISCSLLEQTAMRLSLLVFVALIVAAVSVPEGRCAAPAGLHSQWLDVMPAFMFNAPIDDDVAILNASLSGSFRFKDLNTTDTELLLSVASGK